MSGTLLNKIKESVVLQITTLLIAALCGIFGVWWIGCVDFFIYAYGNIYQVDEHSMKIEEHEVHLAEIEQAQQQNQQDLLRQLETIQRQQQVQNTLFGLAAKVNCCRSDEDPWVRVNVSSPAFRFQEGDVLKITKRGKEEQSIKAEVRGVFRAENSAYLLQMNRLAFDMLEASNLSEIGVMVERAGSYVD